MQGVRRYWLATAVLAIVTLAIAACGGDDESGADESAEAAQTEASDGPCRVGIDIPYHPLYDYVMANQDRYFGDEPYEVSMRILDAATLVPSFGKDELDVIATLPSFIPRIVDQHEVEPQFFFPLARITKDTVPVYVPEDSSAQTIEDLKGEKVAIQPLRQLFGEEEAAVLAATGESIREYFDLTESGANTQELLLGRAEAAFLNGPGEIAAATEEGGFRRIWSVGEGFEQGLGDPNALSGGFIALPEFIEANPACIEGVTAALQDAWDRYQEDPEEVATVASEESGIPVQQLLGVGEYLDLAGTSREDRTINERDVETWSEIYPLLAESGFLEEAPEDPERFFRVQEQE